VASTPSGPSFGPPTTPAVQVPAGGEGSASDEPQEGAAEAQRRPVPTIGNGPVPTLQDDETSVMPEIASGMPVRWADIASPWLSSIGGDSRGTRWEAGIMARVALRFDDDKAALVHDEEYEAVLFPLGDLLDASRSVAVDYDDRDLRTDAPTPCTYRLPSTPLKPKTRFDQYQRDLVDHLVRSQSVELQTNRDLKLFSRPGETPEAFAQRCDQAASDAADAEAAKLRTKYETKLTSIQGQMQTAEGRTKVLEEQKKGQRNDEILSTAGSILGGFLGGKSRGSLLNSVLGKAGSVAGKHGRASATGERLNAAESKLSSLQQQYDELEASLTKELADIDAKWKATAGAVSSMQVPLERTDVKVVAIALVWIPVP